MLNNDLVNDFIINKKESVYNAFFKMQNENMSTIPVVDDKENFIGAFAMKDIAKKESISEFNVKTRLYRIRKKIKKELNDGGYYGK